MVRYQSLLREKFSLVHELSWLGKKNGLFNVLEDVSIFEKHFVNVYVCFILELYFIFSSIKCTTGKGLFERRVFFKWIWKNPCYEKILLGIFLVEWWGKKFICKNFDQIIISIIYLKLHFVYLFFMYKELGAQAIFFLSYSFLFYLDSSLKYLDFFFSPINCTYLHVFVLIFRYW